MKLLVAIASPALALSLASCITVVVAPTPLPTTPAPAQPTHAESSSGICISYKEAASHVGETTCVRGFVSSTNKSGTAFFIDFDNARESFYAVSFKHTWDNLRGRCVEIAGKVSLFRGRPQIIIDDESQLSFC